MRKSVAALAVLFSGLLGPQSPAAFGAIYSFDSPGDVALSATQSPGAWYVDRYAPAVFAGGMTAPDARPGTLLELISAGDSSSNRPSAYSSAFYNTQGRKFDMPVGTSQMFVDLYIPHMWDALLQTENLGRLASFWGTGVDSSSQITSFPIIEFNNNVDGNSANGFRIWDSFANTWNVVPGFTGFDQWYRIGFTVGSGQEQFFVNGNLVGTIADPTTVQIENAILQGYNSGQSYDIYWDNLEAFHAPEPSSLVVFGSLAIAFAVIRSRYRS